MDRMREVAALWNWLPAFRAVAETEHLPTAAERLAVSPSALSRTIGLIEDELGRPLFARVGRRLELNDAGRLLLSAARDAMRTMHEGMLAIRGEQMVGSARVAGDAALLAALMPDVLLHLGEQHPRLDVALRDLPEAIEPSLLRGELDVVIARRPSHHPEVVEQALGRWSRGLYAAPNHPLARRKRISASDLAAHPMVVPTHRELIDPESQRWPTGFRPNAWLEVDAPSVAMAIVAAGEAIVPLEDRLAGAREGLVRLAFTRLPPTELFALHRHRVGPAGSTEAVVSAIELVARAG